MDKIITVIDLKEKLEFNIRETPAYLINDTGELMNEDDLQFFREKIKLFSKSASSLDEKSFAEKCYILSIAWEKALSVNNL